VKKKGIALHIGLIIRNIRTEKGLSQEDLSYKCDLHRTYIGSIERAEKIPTIVTLEKVADALGVSLSEIFKQYEKIKNL